MPEMTNGTTNATWFVFLMLSFVIFRYFGQRWFPNLDVNDYFEACGLFFFVLSKPITMTTSSYCKQSH